MRCCPSAVNPYLPLSAVRRSTYALRRAAAQGSVAHQKCQVPGPGNRQLPSLGVALHTQSSETEELHCRLRTPTTRLSGDLGCLEQRHVGAQLTFSYDRHRPRWRTALEARSATAVKPIVNWESWMAPVEIATTSESRAPTARRRRPLYLHFYWTNDLIVLPSATMLCSCSLHVSRF